MKKNLKIAALLFAALMTGGVALSSCSDNDDDKVIETVITESELPEAAKTFISSYYPDIKVVRVEKERTGGTVLYDVDFQNGQEVTFDASGNWVEVDAPDGKTIPSGIVPETIQTYLDANYSGYGVNDITKTRNGYEVELVTGVDLLFDAQGNFQRID